MFRIYVVWREGVANDAARSFLRTGNAFVMDTICSRFDDNGWRWLNQFVSLLPIPKYKHDISIIDLVNNIDSMNQQSNSLEINNFVNQIFGFTKEECELLNKRFEKY